MVLLRVVACAFALLVLAAATNVEQCPGKSETDLNDNVQLLPCKKLPCKLKKGTSEKVTIKFTPESDVPIIYNSVTAEVAGIPLPFVGVHGNSICSKVYTEDGEKASCPLKAGTKYEYRDSFPVEQFYPAIPVHIEWSLTDKEKKSIICFRVPAKIVN